MKYADIIKIFNEVYIANNDDEMDYARKWLDALREGKDDLADAYKRKANDCRCKNKGAMQLIGRIQELAKKSGEDVYE